MNKRAWISIAALGALLSQGASAPAEAPPSATPPAATPPAAAEATSLSADPPKAEKTKAPTPEEWKTATPVKLDRNTSSCQASRVREWLKIHCESLPAAGVSLLAGQVEGVQVWVDQSSEGGPEAMKKLRPVEVIFPVRRGDGRLIQLAQFGEGYDGPIGWNVGATVSEQWVEGEPSPIIAAW